MCQFSIIIPTLQKNLSVLNNLLDELVQDETIAEILLVDNSLKGFSHKSEKIKVIIPTKNLYVNPSWNLGVKLAKSNYIGVLNDDIVIPKNLCKQVLEIIKNSPNMGLLGMKSDALIETDEAEFCSYPQDCELKIMPQDDNLYVSHWGIAIFGSKERFYKIPNNIKIYCGDNYLIHRNTLNGNICYQMSNCTIRHLGSLSSNAKNLNQIKSDDVYNYAKIDRRFKEHCWFKNRPNIIETVFSIKNDDIHKLITVLGIKFKFKSKKLIARKRIQQLEQELSRFVQKSNNLRQELENLKQEYNDYKQAQIIDKQDADKERRDIYSCPICIESDDPRAYSINWIKENSKVLDVGCACGDFGDKLKELKNAEITGLEYNSQSIEIAKQTGAYENIIQCDLNKYKNIPLSNQQFDYIVCGDVLEHIYEPQNVLEHFKQYLKDDGYFLLSIPNIAHASIKSNLLLDNFDYTPMGLLDQTHIRFFTYKTVVNSLSDLNLEIEDCRLTHGCGLNGFQPNNPYPDIPQEIREFILRDKHSSIVQYVVKCKKSAIQDLVTVNMNKIEAELNNTPYMQGIEEYLSV